MVGIATNSIGQPVYIVDGVSGSPAGSTAPLPVVSTTSTATGTLPTASTLPGARINVATLGDNIVIAATASVAARVYAMRISVAGAVIVQVKNGAGTILEVFNFAGAGGAVVLDLRDRPYYTTDVNTAFILNLSAAVQVDGRVEFIYAP